MALPLLNKKEGGGGFEPAMIAQNGQCNEAKRITEEEGKRKGEESLLNIM